MTQSVLVTDIRRDTRLRFYKVMAVSVLIYGKDCVVVNNNNKGQSKI